MLSRKPVRHSIVVKHHELIAAEPQTEDKGRWLGFSLSELMRSAYQGMPARDLSG